MDGAAMNGVATDGAATDGVATDVAVTESVATDCAATDGAAMDGAATDSAATDGAATDGAAMDGAATDGAATDSAATDGAATDGAVMDGEKCVLLTKRLIAALLGEHAYYRKLGQWPLLDCEGISNMFKLLASSRLAPDVPYAPPQLVRGYLAAGSCDNFTNETVLCALTKWFPALPDLLRIGGPHLAVMGGAVLQALVGPMERHRQEGPQDIDLFVVGLDEAAAAQLIEKLMAFLVARERALPHPDDDPDGDHGNVDHDNLGGLLLRSQFHVSFCDREDRVYQFILETSPSVSALVGVADLHATGFVWCDNALYGTRLAAFSAGARVLIVDPACWSLSYESRIMKYQMRAFAVVFPHMRLPLDGASEYSVGGLTVQLVEHAHLKRMLAGGGCRIALAGRGLRTVPMKMGDRILGHARTPVRPCEHLLSITIDPNLRVHESAYSSSDIRDGGAFYNVLAASRGKFGSIVMSAGELSDLLEAPKTVSRDCEQERNNGDEDGGTVKAPDQVTLEDSVRAVLCAMLNKGESISLHDLVKLYGTALATRLAPALILHDEESVRAIVDERTTYCAAALRDAEKRASGGLRVMGHLRGCFAPAPKRASEWYSPRCFEPLEIGLPHALWLAIAQSRFFHDGFRKLSRDVFRMLMQRYVVPAILSDSIERSLQLVPEAALPSDADEVGVYDNVPREPRVPRGRR